MGSRSSYYRGIVESGERDAKRHAVAQNLRKSWSKKVENMRETGRTGRKVKTSKSDVAR